MFGGSVGQSLVVGIASVAIGVGASGGGDRGPRKPADRPADRQVYARVEIKTHDEDRGRWTDRRRAPAWGHEQEPRDLTVRAYRAGSNVVVVVTGINPSAGFHTVLERDALDKIRLINRAPRDRCAEAFTTFEIAGTFWSPFKDHLKLCVAGREIEVCITEARKL